MRPSIVKPNQETKMKFAALGLPAVLRPKLIAVSTFALLAASSATNALAQVAAAQWATTAGADGTDALSGQSYNLGASSTQPGLSQEAASGTGLSLSAQSWVGNQLGDPTASVSASAQSGCLTCGGSAYGSADFTYFVEILGPAGPVPLHVNAFGVATSSNGYGDSASASLDLGGSGLGGGAGYGYYAQSGGTGYKYYPNFTVNTTLQADANVPISVAGEVHVYENASGGTASAGFAYVDPYFSIDPSFPNASLYSIVVSPGVGNSPITPGLPAPGPTPGAGLASLVFLMLAGVANRARGFLVR
jgi:hypothetical protein